MPSSYWRPTSTVGHSQKTPRVSFLALQHLRSKEPFFSLPRPKKRRKSFCPAFSQDPPQGLATLSWASEVLHTLEASFSPQHSWASPFKALLLPGDRKKVSLLLSALALPYKTFQALYRRFSGLLPPEKPCSFLHPDVLRRVGASCSLGLSNLSGSPSADPPKRASPSLRSPSRP